MDVYIILYSNKKCNKNLLGRLNMKYRYVCLLLALLTVGSQFAGCSGEEPAETENNTVFAETAAETEDDGFIHDDLPEKDFLGADMQILTTTWYTATKYIYAAEENGEVINDALFAQRAEVSERFNVEIGLTAEEDLGAVASRIHNLTMAGDDTYDLAYNHDLMTIGNALKGDFYNLRAVDIINFDKPWWNGSTEVFTIQGKLPCTANPLALSGIYMNYVLTVNKDLAANLQIEIPYETVRQGKWYIDELISLAELATIDLDGNGILDYDDQWGLLTGSYGQMGMQSDMEGTVLDKDDAGNLIFVDTLEHMVAILEKTDRLMEYTVDDYGPANEFGVELFIAGKGLFMFAENRNLYETVRDAEIAYGVLPFPKFDENQKEYRSSGCDIYWGIPLPAAGNKELIGTCVEAMSCYNYNYVVPKVWDTVLGGKLADSPDDEDMFKIIRDVQYVDLGYAFSGENSKLSEMIFLIQKTDAGSVTSFIESRKTAVQSKLEEINRVYAEME